MIYAPPGWETPASSDSQHPAHDSGHTQHNGWIHRLLLRVHTVSGWQSTLIKSKVIKGILIQSLPNCCHFLAAACGQTVHMLRDIIIMERG